MYSLSYSFVISVFSTVNLSSNLRIQYLLCSNYCPKLICYLWFPSYFLGELNMIIWSFSQLLSIFADRFEQFTKYYYLLFLKYNSVLFSYSQELTATKIIILQLCRLEIWHGLHWAEGNMCQGCAPSGGSRGGSVSLLLPASRSYFHYLAPKSFLHLQKLAR